MGSNNITISVTGGTKDNRLIISHLIKNNISPYVNCKLNKLPNTILETALNNYQNNEITIEENELPIKEIQTLVKDELEDIRFELKSIKKDIEIFDNELFGKLNHKYLNYVKSMNKKINLLVNELNNILSINHDVDHILSLINEQDIYFPVAGLQKGLMEFEVVCDETNNSEETIKNNELYVDIYFPGIISKTESQSS